MKNIPYGRHNINQSDIDSVIEVLQSNFLTQGPVVPMFEKAVSDYCGAKFAVAANSATSALHIACLALDVGRGDIVWTSSITFVASANCAVFCGANIDFIDIDPNTYNLSVDSLALKLVIAEREGRLPKVVIPVHLCGQSCEMADIYLLSKRYGFRIIEDASHAIGANYKGEAIGGCKYSDVTIFSFHPVKIITSAEGGMALTNDENLARKMRQFCTHGITNLPADLVGKPKNELWNYEQVNLGFNYRMTDMQAALGLSQMERLDIFVQARQEISSSYDRLLANFPLTRPWQHPDSISARHLYVVRLNFQLTRKTQKQVYAALHSAGILVNLHYIPVYRHKYYEEIGFCAGYCPEAESYFHEALSLPIYPNLSSADVDYISSTLDEVLG